jgi:DNA-binding transcriptional ArsR family regulator
VSDTVGPVFAALADPTRRRVVETLLRDGTTSVPSLTSVLPISRQAVAKHLATLDDAGLLERAPASGREVRYRLRGEALTPATTWLRDAETAWEQRLARLKGAVERGA